MGVRPRRRVATGALPGAGTRGLSGGAVPLRDARGAAVPGPAGEGVLPGDPPAPGPVAPAVEPVRLAPVEPVGHAIAMPSPVAVPARIPPGSRRGRRRCHGQRAPSVRAHCA